ncbi:glycosyltransferase family 2 protein [Glaciecola sp. MF2-115]|uniref:glycosyltransferase family 2 protein n=1 Tax=Glaciecola sp. MF2-115 TaxID=3384827 RepID=UPI0039A2338F
MNSKALDKDTNDMPVSLFSIVMPAYNEESVIEQTLIDLTTHLDSCGFNYEIVVVNDGSSDNTEQVLEKIEANLKTVRHVNNEGSHGYGYAIRKGLEEYKGDAVVIVTSDGSDAPKDIAAYFNKIKEGYDCAFGSRFIADATVTDYPKFKLIINRITNRLLSWVLRSKYTDFTNGFKCYRRHVIDDMQPLVAGQFNITIELAVSATLRGWTYAVVPTDWTQRDAGDSSFYIKQLLKPYFLTLIYCLTRNYLRNTRR